MGLQIIFMSFISLQLSPHLTIERYMKSMKPALLISSYASCMYCSLACCCMFRKSHLTLLYSLYDLYCIPLGLPSCTHILRLVLSFVCEIIYKDKINTSPESIANGFADYLHELYQPSTKSSFDDRTLHEINEAYAKIKQTCKEETMLYLEDRLQKMMLLLLFGISNIRKRMVKIKFRTNTYITEDLQSCLV
jgi:hypothetical protein